MDNETPAGPEPYIEDREFVSNIFQHWGLISELIRIEATGHNALGTRLTLDEMMEATRAAWRRKDNMVPITVIPTPDQTAVVALKKVIWHPMDNAFDQLTEYLRLRRAADEYYQSHPEMQAILNDLHTLAPDKLTEAEGARLAYEMAQYANLQETRRIKAEWSSNHRQSQGSEIPLRPTQEP